MGVCAVADSVVAAVADGHGTSKHADVGARLAVQVALTSLVRFAADLGERASNLTQVRKCAEHPLRMHIVREWKAQVRAKAGDDESPLSDYGSTLIVALATPDFLLVGQLGDGDVLLVAKDGKPEVLLPADPAAFADETSSLCLPEAEYSLRMRALRAPVGETLLVLSTDGYSKSYPTDAAFRQIGPDYLNLIRKNGVSALNLRGFLEQTTAQGAGDDIGLALIYWPPSTSQTVAGSSIISSENSPQNEPNRTSMERPAEMESDESPTGNLEATSNNWIVRWIRDALCRVVGTVKAKAILK